MRVEIENKYCDLKYYIGKREITEAEYFEYLYEDAKDGKVPSPKKAAKNVCEENKSMAFLWGKNTWYCEDGTKLTIKQSLLSRLDKIKDYAEVIHRYALKHEEYFGDEFECLVDYIEELKEELENE